MIIFFCICGIISTMGILYAAINFVANERAIRRSEVSRKEQLKLTFKDISTTCNQIENAQHSDTKTIKALTRELEETRRYLEKYY